MGRWTDIPSAADGPWKVICQDWGLDAWAFTQANLSHKSNVDLCGYARVGKLGNYELDHHIRSVVAVTA
jgi:hypothetical protein